MVHVHGLKDENLKFGSQRPSNASSPSFFSSHLGVLPKEGLRLPIKPSYRSNLATTTPITFEAITGMCTVETKTTRGASQGGSSTT